MLDTDIDLPETPDLKPIITAAIGGALVCVGVSNFYSAYKIRKQIKEIDRRRAERAAEYDAIMRRELEKLGYTFDPNEYASAHRN